MNFSMNQSELCLRSELISAPPFSTVLALEMITGLLSVAPNLLLLVAVSRAKVYPANLRYLLFNLSFCLILQSIAAVFKANETLYLSLKDPCLLIVNTYDCKIRDLAFNIAGTVIFFTLLAISLERLYCVVRYRKHDYSSSSPTVAVIFIAIMWFVSIFGSASGLRSTPTNAYLPVCELALTASGAAVAGPMMISLAIEIVPLFIIILVRAYDQYNLKNTAINRVQHTLNFRFQLIQSAQMNAVIVPSLVLHAVCFMPTLTLYFVVLYGMQLEIHTKWHLFHACTIYRLIYAFVHPLLAFNRNPRLKQQLRKGALAKMTARVWHSTWDKNVGHRLPVCQEMRPVNNGSIHFNVLDKLWASGPKKKH